MSYTGSLNNYRSLADRIRSGDYKPAEAVKVKQEKREGLVARPQRETAKEEAPAPQQDQNADLQMQFAEYMAMMKKDKDMAETPTRPRSRQDGGFDTPIKPLMVSTFQEQLGLDESTSDVLTRAFLMNFQDESGMVPDRVEMEPNVHGTRGKGYYQLTGARRDEFESIYGEDGYTSQNQIEFLAREIMTTEKAAGKAILAAAQSGDVGETAAIIVDKFLRPAEKHKIERMNRYRGIGT